VQSTDVKDLLRWPAGAALLSSTRVAAAEHPNRSKVPDRTIPDEFGCAWGFLLLVISVKALIVLCFGRPGTTWTQFRQISGSGVTSNSTWASYVMSPPTPTGSIFGIMAAFPAAIIEAGGVDKLANTFPPPTPGEAVGGG
jgi:hypothetical protein